MHFNLCGLTGSDYGETNTFLITDDIFFFVFSPDCIFFLTSEDFFYDLYLICGIVSNLMCEVAQLYPTLCNPMDCSLPGSSVHGILQARILEWVTISFSKGSSWPRDRIRVSCIGGRRLNLWATREVLSSLIRSQFIARDRCIGNLIVNGGCFSEHGMLIKWYVP